MRFQSSNKFIIIILFREAQSLLSIFHAMATQDR